MDRFRALHSVGLILRRSAQERANYIREHDVFHHMGNNCMVMFRKIPLYPKLISIGNNVWIASNVTFVTHDVIHRMLNNRLDTREFQEKLGCIDIKDNVFIGSNTTILPDVTIGPNTVIGAGSLINKSIPGNGVYGGVPAKYISSLDSFIERRRKTTRIAIRRGTGGLSDETVKAIWKRFKERERYE